MKEILAMVMANCGAGETHTCAHVKFRGDPMCRERRRSNSLALSGVSNFRRSLCVGLLEISHVCISPVTQSPPPKLENTRSL